MSTSPTLRRGGESMVAQDFREVAHCGFRLAVNTRTSADGERSYNIAISGSRPNAMSVAGLYVLPPGLPLAMIDFRGIGSFGNPPPVPTCITVFLGSDSEGHFGHQCPSCGGYWRSDRLPVLWEMSCAYCGVRASAHVFRTAGQKRYLQACCQLLNDAMLDTSDGAKVLELDAAADIAMSGGQPPAFYYAEEAQQTRFSCSACRAWNDILGRFGYCSSCGTRNDLQQFELRVGAVRERINRETLLEECVRTLVSDFDSMAKQLTKELIANVPLVKSRRARLEGRSFHDFQKCVADFREFFGIELLRQCFQGDESLGRMMFERRHAYEHNGGVVDARYLERSGDETVRLGELLRESRDNVAKLAGLVQRMARNLHDGFHELLPPVAEALEGPHPLRDAPDNLGRAPRTRTSEPAPLEASNGKRE